MMKALVSSLVVAIAAVSASAVPITITLTAPPSSNPANPAGIYDVGEVVQVTATLSAPSQITNLGLAQIDYSLSTPGGVDVNSDACAAGSPICSQMSLEVNPPNSNIYARISANIPSTAVIPVAGVPFITFNATVLAGGTTVNILGPNSDDDSSGAYFTTDTFDIVWDNTVNPQGAEAILGGTLLLNVPEPSSIALLVLGGIAAIRRRR